MGSAHRLDGRTFDKKFDKIHSRGSKDMNQTQNIKWFKSSMNLTLSQPGWNMGSAHHLDGLNI
jgi:hypothetical protein